MAITTGDELIDAAYYAQHGPPHDTWTRPRAESPVHWCEPDGYEPFWAITKYADICEMSTQPHLFLNKPCGGRELVGERLGLFVRPVAPNRAWVGAR